MSPEVIILLPQHRAKLDELLDNYRHQNTASQEAQQIYEKFLTRAFFAPREEKDEITRLFALHIGGAVVRSDDWLNRVGRNLNGVGNSPTKKELTRYWQGVRSAFPELISDQDLDWLSRHDSDLRAFECFLAINNEWAPSQSLLAGNVIAAIIAWK